VIRCSIAEVSSVVASRDPSSFICAAELESAGIKVNAACPGFTATDLNYFRGAPSNRLPMSQYASR